MYNYFQCKFRSYQKSIMYTASLIRNLMVEDYFSVSVLYNENVLFKIKH